MPSPTRETLFPAARLSPRERAEHTNSAARAIIDAEVNARESKTERLRQARLALEAKEAADAPPPVAAKPKRVRKAKTA